MTASSAGGPGCYSAGQGFDLASGLGSIDAANLVAAMSALAAPTGLTATAGADGISLQWNADAAATSFDRSCSAGALQPEPRATRSIRGRRRAAKARLP